MPSETGRDRGRRSFWLGLLVGVFVGAALFFLIGYALWDPIVFGAERR